MSLDLEEGDEVLAEASPSERRRAARKAAAEVRNGKKPTPATPRRSSNAVARDRVEAELLSRLNRTFDRIAKMLETREDEELAHAIRDDSEAMSQGLVSLTGNVKLLRGPLIMALNLVEPALAFGRVGRILYRRFVDRQARVAQERAEQQERMSSPLATQ